MNDELSQHLADAGFTVWTAANRPDDEEVSDQTFLITHDDRHPQVARVVKGQKDNTAIHVDAIQTPSDYDIVFVDVDGDTGFIVIDPSGLSTKSPRIPLDKPSPLEPRRLSDWLP